MKAKPIECRNLIEFFNERMRTIKDSGRNCLEIIRKKRKEALTFGELQIKAKEFAHYLIKHKGIEIGDRVAILAKNQANWDVVFWGVVLAGAIPVLIDPERRIGGVKRHLAHTESKLIVVDDDYQDAERLVKSQNSIKMNVLFATKLRSDFEQIQERIKQEDIAVILCTSGTTDNPKEVELSHSNLLANVQGSLDAVEVESSDRIGHILPPHHSFGLTVGKLLSFSAGALNIYTDKYNQIGRFIGDKRITIFIGVPALFQAMSKKMEKLNFLQRAGLRLSWRKLRFCLSGSAPLSIRTLDIFWKRGIRLYEGYGTTENSPVYGFNNNPSKLGSVGKPIETILVKIAEGEILLAGPCIMKGYYKNLQATTEAIEQDEKGARWLKTGDLGYLDKDGYLFVTGRKKNIIVLPNGKNVNPESVEKVLSSAKYVKEVLVVPFGRGLKALVVLDREELGEDSFNARSLVWASVNDHQHQSKELSSFEMVSSIEFVDEFAKTSNGKIKRSNYVK